MILLNAFPQHSQGVSLALAREPYQQAEEQKRPLASLG